MSRQGIEPFQEQRQARIETPERGVGQGCADNTAQPLHALDQLWIRFEHHESRRRRGRAGHRLDSTKDLRRAQPVRVSEPLQEAI
jgi:hypothetical protein